MPFITNCGTRIHYEVDGSGPPLVLQHSLVRSLEAWYDYGYAQELRLDHRLVLIDARGHGASDKPHDPAAYAPHLRAADVVAVLDDLGIDQAHYMGYSMGARIGFSMIAYALPRVRSLILGGMSPYHTAAEAQFQMQLRQSLEMGMEAYVANAERIHGPYPPEVRARQLANDAQALLAAIAAASDPSQPPVDWDRLLPTMTVPCLVYAGSADPFYAGAAKCAGLMPNTEFVPLPGLDHREALVRSDLVLPHVRNFLASLGQGPA